MGTTTETYMVIPPGTSELDAAKSEIERLRAALKPFADFADKIDADGEVTKVGMPSLKDLYRAREILNR